MDQVAQVRAKTDIVTLINEFVPLKKTGQNFKANCPFHGEKTPSFVVSPQRQIWHCFGCHKGGDAFTFLMQYENLEFPEALRMLAQRAGIALVQTAFQTGVSSKKEIIYTVNRQAMEFYHYVLTSHPAGKKALAYVREERKISDKVLKTFMVGFAPSGGNVLVRYLLTKKKHKADDLLEAGIAIRKSSGISDFFVNRLMFPLFDHRGNVEGFSGRLLDNQPSLPKYVNTRETLVYHKGNVFFGLNIAKDEIKAEKRAIVMEGEFDVMSSFQEGIGNAVAVKGSALTEQQTNLIARFCEKVGLCFDADNAGQDAIIRSIPHLEKKGLTITVIVPPNGKDPDEVLHTDPALFKQAVKHDIPVYDYLLEKIVGHIDATTAEGKKRATNVVLPFLHAIENEVVKEHYLKKLAQLLDTSYESVVRQEARLAVHGGEESMLKMAKDKRPRREVLEEYVLGLILQSKTPKLSFVNFVAKHDVPLFSIPSYEKLVSYLSLYFEKNNEFDFNSFLKNVPPELFSSFDRCFLLPLPIFTDDVVYQKEIEKVVKDLRVISLREEIKRIGEQIQKQEKEGLSQEALEELQSRFSELAKMLKDASNTREV